MYCPLVVEPADGRKHGQEVKKMKNMQEDQIKLSGV